MADLKRGQGPIDQGKISALGADERQALLVTAADVLMNRKGARGALFVAHIGGDAHRDVLEWAATHHDPAIAQAGAEALTTRCFPSLGQG